MDLPGLMVLPKSLQINIPPAVSAVAEAAVGRNAVMRAVASAVLQVCSSEWLLGWDVSTQDFLNLWYHLQSPNAPAGLTTFTGCVASFHEGPRSLGWSKGMPEALIIPVCKNLAGGQIR